MNSKVHVISIADGGTN